ncbi:hypothetical protein GSI_09193 [Ganoderma sinense ZZ0214-1]|uniref:Uncharacterized protein n=1 Tax=Ganoderma sinense ZZ0214-1 TaxID=1077348 RepID=A0A2G8S5Y0_9APHY|nr:hypothetical protein GSI_09193 [Ganoderma sinense ZZ0214-1]
MSSLNDSSGPSTTTAALPEPCDLLLDHDDSEVSDNQSESSSRSVTPEPKRPAQAKNKSPPFPFEYGKSRVRKMLPRLVLPRLLDPRCVAIQAPTDIPLCWLGIPFSFASISTWAKNSGLGVPCTEGYYSRIPGSIDVMKSWLALLDHFYEETGITIDIRDVWGAEYPILAFISNRQTCDITMDQHRAIEDVLEDMEFDKEEGPMWYLDKRELY